MESSGNSTKFCYQCGQEIDASSKFCPNCGATQQNNSASSYTHIPGSNTVDKINEVRKAAGKTASSFTSTVMKKANELTGETGEVKLNLKDLFVNVFKKHSKDEREEIFICGTKTTTPAESEISASWPKPWLYSRIFILFAITFIVLSLLVTFFSNTNALPGMIFIGALAVPFSTLVFFFEVNAPRNTSIFETIKIFFIGGVLSLLVTLFLFLFTPSSEMGFIDAIITGIVEEIGKLVIVAYFCKQPNVKHILTGMLIGSAVGAGFAVFETAGYAFNFLFTNGWNSMLEVIYLRAALAIGGHVIWAAISGGALVLIKKNEKFKKEHIFNIRFLKIFAIPVILHAVWDMPLPMVFGLPMVQIICTILAWVMALIMINTGLKQISTSQTQETPVEETPAEETPAEETSVEETPAEETPAKETPAKETPAKETPVEETPAEGTPVNETVSSGVQE